jgi:hypothetical protein
MKRLIAFAVIVAALAAPAVAGACGSGYSYAGVTTADRVFGVSAGLTSLAAPAVQSGHVAGWVGVGVPDEWIQVGFSGFPGLTVGSLYYEVALPGVAPRYFEVLSNVQTGERHRVAVLETGHRRDSWRVWVDGAAVGPVYRLPESHGAWRGVATGENWGGGVRSCNHYAYRFDGVKVASAPGGSWRSLGDVSRTQPTRLLMNAQSTGFVVSA